MDPRRWARALRGWVDDPVVTPGMLKAAIATILALALAVPLSLVAVPYIEFFNDMAVQYKVKPQMAWREESGAVVPGSRPPPEGTAPQGVHAYPFPLRVPAGADAEAWRRIEQETLARAEAALLAGGPDIAPPFRRPAPTMAGVQRGKRLFDTHCIVCHGPYGMGDGTVPQRGFPTPPSLLDRKERDFSDAHLFHVVTTGQNRVMPSYAPALAPEDRWAVVSYVRALQAAFPAPPAPPGPSAGAGSGSGSAPGGAP